MGGPWVQATAELRSYGWVWLVLGTAILAAGAAAGLLADLESVTIALALTVLGLSTASMIGALVLGRRSGPQVLYGRIFDRAPPAPPDLLVEAPGRTVTRVIPPATLAALVPLLVAPVVMAGVLTVIGISRHDLPEQVPGALMVSSGWTVAAGAVALRVAGYFRHWEERRARRLFCLPMRAGAMRPVYLAAPAADDG